ncbi:MAG: hypothetical protein ACPGJS_18350 [Flammeovirgaceae bacterium]
MHAQDQETLIEVIWGRHMEENNLNDVIPELLSLVKRRQIKSLSLNFRELRNYLPVKVQNGAITGWVPQLKQSGLQGLVILVPHKVIGQMAIRNIFLSNNQQELPITFLN